MRGYTLCQVSRKQKKKGLTKTNSVYMGGLDAWLDGLIRCMAGCMAEWIRCMVGYMVR